MYIPCQGISNRSCAMTTEQALSTYHSGQTVVVKTLCDLSDIIESQKETVAALELKIAKLSKNSNNSSKPPSSDDITKPKTEKKKKDVKKAKIGGQPGHPKHERPLFPKEEIDNFYDYILSACPECNHEDVSILDGKPRIIQQMDIATKPIIKEEHRSYPVWCAKCQKVHYMKLPHNVVKEGLFKERLTALVAYMKHVCHASYSTIRKYIRDVLGEKVSRGYLRKVVEKVSHSLEGSYNDLLDRLPVESIINVDETGHKENKERFWTWVFKAEMYVLFKIDKSRGSKVIIDVLGKEFDGVIGCDFFSAYKKYMKDFDVSVQFCIAHLIRNIRFMVGLKDKETKAYGQRLLDEIKGLFSIIHARDEMDKESFIAALTKAKKKIIETATTDVPSKLDKNGKELKREAKNMADRFNKFGEAYFEFITTPEIEPTNNLAEQAIRFIVIDRYVTQGTRSEKGRKSCERIWTVIATCALQNRSAFNFILEAVNAYFQNQRAPSLLPVP